MGMYQHLRGLGHTRGMAALRTLEELIGLPHRPFPEGSVPEDHIQDLLDLYRTSWNSRKVVELFTAVDPVVNHRIKHGLCTLESYYINGGRRYFTQVQEKAFEELIEQDTQQRKQA